MLFLGKLNEERRKDRRNEGKIEGKKEGRCADMNMKVCHPTNLTSKIQHTIHLLSEMSIANYVVFTDHQFNKFFSVFLAYYTRFFYSLIFNRLNWAGASFYICRSLLQSTFNIAMHLLLWTFSSRFKKKSIQYSHMNTWVTLVFQRPDNTKTFAIGLGFQLTCLWWIFTPCLWSKLPKIQFSIWHLCLPCSTMNEACFNHFITGNYTWLISIALEHKLPIVLQCWVTQFARIG